MVPPPTWMAYSMASTASRESPWRWATSVMAFSASGVTVAFIIVNLSSSVPVRDYASHAGICIGRLAVHLRSARNRMVLAFYPALSVVEWWVVLRCWAIWHYRSSFRPANGHGALLPSPVGVDRFVIRATHERGVGVPSSQRLFPRAPRTTLNGFAPGIQIVAKMRPR